MNSIHGVSVLSGARTQVPADPLLKHLSHFACSDKTALVYADETCSVRVTYSELEARANSLARAIASRARFSGGNRDGDCVIAVCMQPTHNTIITLLGIWKAGAAYVPIEPGFPQVKITHILKDVEPVLVIYDETSNFEMFSEGGVTAVSYEELVHEASGLSTNPLKDIEILATASNESIASVLYTSGSTGISKGVRLSYSAICNRLWWQFHTFPYSISEVNFVWKTSFTFSDSVCEIWGPLLHGRTLIILSKETIRNPQRLVNVLAKYQIQRLVLVPSLLNCILLYLSLNPSERPLKHLQLWVSSGEPLTKDLASRFFKYFGDTTSYKLANFYGCTEVMGDVTYYVLENASQLEKYSSVPIGVPLDNCVIYLLDKQMNPVRENECGEIWVAGYNLATGYVGGQSVEKFCFNQHPTYSGNYKNGNVHSCHKRDSNFDPDDYFSRIFRTGDFGILENGVILYAGRTDSQLKIREYRVDLQEIDQAVAQVEGVEKCVVLSYGVDSGSPEILAFVTIKPEFTIAARHIEAALKSILTHYMIPQVIEVKSFPMLFNGKVDRQALLNMYKDINNNGISKDNLDIPLQIDYSSVSASDMEAAKVLFETVSEVLGLAVRGAVSITADFYELGGNSLNSIYTITKLRDKRYYIDISDFLTATNLGEVLSRMSKHPKSVADDHEMFTVEPLNNEDKGEVINLLESSFYKKNAYKKIPNHKNIKKDYAALMSDSWPALIETQLSVVLKNTSGTTVAVGLNFDARDGPNVRSKETGELIKIMTFLEFLESSVRDAMFPREKGTILYSAMMATAQCLSPRENVAAIKALENATLQLGKKRGFQGVFTTNTSPLTQQLGTDILGYETLLDYQVNQYVDPDGERLFEEAPDDARAIVCWKPLV